MLFMKHVLTGLKISAHRIFEMLIVPQVTQVEVPDGKSICPDPDERTTGVSCVQIYMVWKQGKTHESLIMNARIVW